MSIRDPELKARPSKVRLKDVATAAGVALSTASRALSGTGASEETRAAVLAASERLGYRPDPLARALRTRITGLAGIVVPGISNPFFAELVEALEAALRPYGLEMILGDSSGSVEDEARRLDTMIARKVDGLIVVPIHHHASANALERAARSVALVQVDRQIDGLEADYVGVDNMAGIRAALEHLKHEGCRSVVFVSETGDTSTGRARLHAFQSTIGHVADLKARTPILGSFSYDFGQYAVRKVLHQRRLPDALLCGADVIALGASRELGLKGITIPEDIKISGFDGIFFSELSDPPLTTLRQPVATIADEAARLLDARLRGDNSPPHYREIAPSLIVRRSSSISSDEC